VVAGLHPVLASWVSMAGLWADEKGRPVGKREVYVAGTVLDVVSLVLYLTGRREAGIFVGLCLTICCWGARRAVPIRRWGVRRGCA